MAMATIAAVSQGFRAVTVPAVVRSPPLAAADTGGVLRSTIQALPGPATCGTTMALCPGASTLREMGSLSVASGIKFTCLSADRFDYLHT